MKRRSSHRRSTWAGKCWPAKQLCALISKCRYEMTYRSVSQCHQKIPLGQVRKSPSPIPCWITRQPSLLPWTPLQQGSSSIALHCQSLLALSAVMSLNPKCILCTPCSSLIFIASCFKSRLSWTAMLTPESATSLEIIFRKSSANIENQIY